MYKIFDCFMFFNEVELLEFRLKYLDSVVDYFVITESTHTHSGMERELFFDKCKDNIKDQLHKVIYLPFVNSINNINKSKENWSRENNHRRYLATGLTNTNSKDFLIISDADEIPNREIIKNICNNYKTTTVLEQKLYYYYLNCLQSQKWNGSIICRKDQFVDFQKLRDARNSLPRANNGGWHFSYLGNAERVLDKIKSIAETYMFSNVPNTDPKVLQERMDKAEDILDVDIPKRKTGEMFKKKFVEIDDSYPPEIHDLIKKYPYLIK